MSLNLRQRDGAPPVVVQVWGPGALFTRPEAKVERLTYPLMTPSAAVGVLESIFWKPEFRWDIAAIEVLRPVRFGAVRRNETKAVMSREAALAGQVLDTADQRTQRATTYLLDVAYRIHAHVALHPHATDPSAKYRDQFRRRVARGACFSTPYLGTREFGAFFGPPDGQTPVTFTEDLGVMLHSITFGEQGRNPVSHWFRAKVQAGVMLVPDLDELGEVAG